MEHTQPDKPSTNVLENWVDEAVMSFIVDMKYKLRLNNHKGHWKEQFTSALYAKLVGEMVELDLVLEQYAMIPDSKLLLDIVHECADVANFAMMIADNAKRTMRALDEREKSESKQVHSIDSRRDANAKQ